MRWGYVGRVRPVEQCSVCLQKGSGAVTEQGLAPSQARASVLALAQVSVGVPSDQAFPCLHFNAIQQSQEPCFVIQMNPFVRGRKAHPRALPAWERNAELCVTCGTCRVLERELRSRTVSGTARPCVPAATALHLEPRSADS